MVEIKLITSSYPVLKPGKVIPGHKQNLDQGKPRQDEPESSQDNSKEQTEQQHIDEII